MSIPEVSIQMSYPFDFTLPFNPSSYPNFRASFSKLRAKPKDPSLLCLTLAELYLEFFFFITFSSVTFQLKTSVIHLHCLILRIRLFLTWGTCDGQLRATVIHAAFFGLQKAHDLKEGALEKSSSSSSSSSDSRCFDLRRRGLLGM